MTRPRVKPEHRPYRLDNGTIRIGGEIYGLASEIEDPNGHAWHALELMDGTRTRGEIVTALADRCPNAAELVTTLLDSGHVEDASAAPPPELAPDELDRYARNAAYFRWASLRPREPSWAPQLLLKRARVVVLGLGGTGSHAAWALTAAGVGAIHCVDGDFVELSNLNRQTLYGEEDVGRPKVDVATERLRAVNSHVEVTGENRRIGSPAELARLITGFDVLALCADEPREPDGIRRWANRACAAAGIPWVGGGYEGPQLSVGVFAPGFPCYECLRAEGERHGRMTDFGWPGVLSTSGGLSGLLTAHAVISLLTGIPDVAPGYAYGINLVAPDDQIFVRFPARDECDVCSA
ncbi:ThiF family adenylyltransferase [Nonomuraea sp. NPDC026600]|uniref:HesA/MoeB/ThiF family protein n=1 Tax=Nonomuraea sp. NPDC026600 TaxID=3155363 RepID=UPI003411B8DC